MPFLSLRDVRCRRGDQLVLENLSFDLNGGETLILLGRSGSGKTTVIQLLLRLLAYEAGNVTVEGRDLTDIDPIELRRRTGYVIQEIGLLPHWTIARNIALAPQLQGWDDERISARVQELMSEVNLPYEQYAERLPHELSGGQRQRVGVARALAANPALLLFDEPFGALDPITRRDMQQRFLDLRHRYRIPAIFVTHDVAEALNLGTKIAVLDGGRLEVVAERSEFLECNTPVARAFLNTLPNIKEHQ